MKINEKHDYIQKFGETEIPKSKRTGGWQFLKKLSNHKYRAGTFDGPRWIIAIRFFKDSEWCYISCGSGGESVNTYASDLKEVATSDYDTARYLAWDAGWDGIHRTVPRSTCNKSYSKENRKKLEEELKKIFT